MRLLYGRVLCGHWGIIRWALYIRLYALGYYALGSFLNMADVRVPTGIEMAERRQTLIPIALQSELRMRLFETNMRAPTRWRRTSVVWKDGDDRAFI